MRYAGRPGPRVGRLRTAASAWAALVDLALPRSCGGCGAAGPAWCDRCAVDLAGSVALGGAQPWAPTPCPPGMPVTWAAAPYSGALRDALVAYKDGDRRDLAAVLAPVLAGAVIRAVEQDGRVRAVLEAGNGPVLAVPVPSSAARVRRRGDAPLQGLLDHTVRIADPGGQGLLPAPALRLRRRVADQAGLGHAARAANLEHAMEVRGPWAPVVVGATCLVVDDVLTTGATLVEATRALRRAGARHVVAATAAATRRHGIPGVS